MKRFQTLIVAVGLALSLQMAYAQELPLQAKMLEKLDAIKPAYLSVGKFKVESVVANKEKKTIAVNCNEAVTNMPLTMPQFEALKKEFALELPSEYKDYKIIVMAGDRDLELLTDADSRKIIAPTETDRFITIKDWVGAPQGLDGKNITIWQSHGRYFENRRNRWEWQRPRLFETVEDLYPQSYVIPFLMPMLENAGAYVFNPRERDININEVIVDGDGGFAQSGYEETTGKEGWSDAPVEGFAYAKDILYEGDNPFRMGKVRQVKTVKDMDKVSSAKWYADIPADGMYAVYVSYATLPNSAKDALYRINSLSGTKEIEINQKMGGGIWLYLGHYKLKAGKAEMPVVELLNYSADKDAVVTADAVKIGGGMGNVARRVKPGTGEEGVDYEYSLSGYPRFTEGARYWLQWAGIPDSVYNLTDNEIDYNDDYKCRGEWVNYLTGGSSMWPSHKGLNIPIDISFAFHTDAGITMNDSIIGTLGFYFTKNGDYYVNGTPRYASRDYINKVITNVVDDVRALYEPHWTRRGMWDASYFEARVPEVPAMLLELLSHQNFADMKYGLDPTFRFTVSRAIYKGMLQFIAARDHREYVVQPLPVCAFEIKSLSKGHYLLEWKERVDSLEATATPTYYVVEERLGDDGFKQIAKVEKPKYEVTINDSDIHSYRIIAGNDGGVSFPSEVLALCDKGSDKPQVLIVNGFTRISGPATFKSKEGDIEGFYDVLDHGVPYIYDINYVGTQREFRRDISWMDDEKSGFGASRGDYETKVFAGNTLDFVYDHGKAVAAAGYSFISSSVEAFTSSTDEAKIVDLILGKQKEIKVGRGAYGTRYKAFPAELQERITKLTDAGCDLFVSGAFVASDMWTNPYSDDATLAADQQFATKVLGYQWRSGQATATGEACMVATRLKAFPQGCIYKFNQELNSDLYAVESPDAFFPADEQKGVQILDYKENELAAGIAFDNTKYKTVVIGFPLESLIDPAQQEQLMSEVLTFFTEKTTATPATNDKSKKKKNKK